MSEQKDFSGWSSNETHIFNIYFGDNIKALPKGDSEIERKGIWMALGIENYRRAYVQSNIELFLAELREKANNLIDLSDSSDLTTCIIDMIDFSLITENVNTEELLDFHSEEIRLELDRIAEGNPHFTTI